MWKGALISKTNSRDGPKLKFYRNRNISQRIVKIDRSKFDFSKFFAIFTTSDLEMKLSRNTEAKLNKIEKCFRKFWDFSEFCSKFAKFLVKIPSVKMGWYLFYRNRSRNLSFSRSLTRQRVKICSKGRKMHRLDPYPTAFKNFAPTPHIWETKLV